MESVDQPMPESRFVTFRDQTTGRINDLLEDEHKPCAPTQNLLAYLAGALLSYRDEGSNLRRRSCCAMAWRPSSRLSLARSPIIPTALKID
jgi:hypothetical protein